jgi:hypothetical protein
MRIAVHLAISILLAMTLSSAFAGSHKSKPAGNGASPPAAQRPGSQKPGTPGAAQQNQDRNQEREQDKDRNQAREQDQDRIQGQGQNKDSAPDKNSYGQERSREMLDQRDQRKEQKTEYKSNRTPGQEGKGDDNKDGPDNEKKPWYRFWE